MEAQTTGNKMHPVLWIAAIAVILLSAAGIGAIFGVIPTADSSSKQSEPVAAVPAPAATAAPAAAAKPAEPASAETKPAPAKKVAAAKPAESKPAPKAETQPAQAAAQPAPPAAPAICVNCGTIESVTEKTQKGEGTGIGAVAGHQAERYIRKTTKWEIIVRFEDGTAREFDLNTQPAWRVGDKVKVENNVITAR